MGKLTRNWGPGGTDRDEFGLLPPKRLERLYGIDPARPRTLSDSQFVDLITDYYENNGKKPSVVTIPGIKNGVKTKGFIVYGIGYVDLNIRFDPNIEDVMIE